VTGRDFRDVVAAKRDGRTLARGEVEAFVLAFGRGEIPDPLASAFLMACLIRGMDASETLAMTQAMIASGDTVSFDGVDLPTVDKHSTGGVADGVTLVFAPLAAALGLGVAKLSGRGLGHTGGTLDKLESIPGFRTDLTPAQIERQVSDIGCAVAAQSANLVPADGAMYALRDATATVPSTPLIAASVMSKKLAVGTDLILLDVKAGSGAFMKTADDARSLARECLALAGGAGRRAHVSVTDMSQPLGEAIGNALDVAEAVAVLRGERPGRLGELCVWFAARASVELTGTAPEDARTRAERAIADGSALDRLRMMITSQGGDPRVVDDPAGILPAAPVRLPIEAPTAGTLAAVDAEALGNASGALGAGRRRKGDPIDPAVGIVFTPKVGDRLDRGEGIGEVHARTDDDASMAAERVLAALTFVDGAVDPPALVIDAFGGEEG
jgi:pyrimidine-nucleoside phosphorylase